MPLILFSEENRKRDSSTRKKHARYQVEQQKEKSELPTHSILAKKKRVREKQDSGKIVFEVLEALHVYYIRFYTEVTTSIYSDLSKLN